MTDAKPGDVVSVVYDAQLSHLRAATSRETKGRRGDMLWLGGSAFAHTDLASMLVPIEELHHHPRNARRGDVQAIAASIRANGLYRPAYVQRSTSLIVAGNHTTAALRELEAQLAPRLLLDVDDDQAVRILLADNRTADLGEYAERELLDTLRELSASSELGLIGTAYDPEEVERIARVVAYSDLGPIDAAALWNGMPDYSSQDMMTEYRTSIRFRTPADADAFFQLIGKAKASIVFWPEPWLPQHAFTADDGPRVELLEGGDEDDDAP